MSIKSKITNFLNEKENIFDFINDLMKKVKEAKIKITWMERRPKGLKERIGKLKARKLNIEVMEDALKRKLKVVSLWSDFK